MNDETLARWVNFTYIVIAAVVFVFLGLAVLGCTGTRYVAVPEVHTEVQTREVHDTLLSMQWRTDSVVVMMKGDTVYHERWRVLYRDRWKTSARTDTLVRVDSVRVPMPVERQLTKWERVKMDVGGWALGGLSVGVVAAVFYFVRRLKH